METRSFFALYTSLAALTSSMFLPGCTQQQSTSQQMQSSSGAQPSTTLQQIDALIDFVDDSLVTIHTAQAKKEATSTAEYYELSFGKPDIALNKNDLTQTRITTNRLSFRPATTSDAYNHHHYLFDDARVMRHYMSGDTLPLERTKKRLERWEQRWKKHYPFAGFTITRKHSQAFVGYIVMGNGEEKNSAEMARAIKFSEQGKKIGTEIAGAISLYWAPFLRKQGYKVNNDQNFDRIITTNKAENIASWKSVENLGFSRYKTSVKYGYKRNHYELWLDSLK